ncbi:MAG: hypothetical protein HBSIN02_19540 [Bacteroidia bacterium]|nr:MAG: hypothetical protein HBSIN02_19540 [Bacteroidia bacterium]
MKRAHISTGILTLLAFLGTGMYMRVNFPELYGDREAIRFLFRANHVYILFSALLNIMAGMIQHSPQQSGVLQKGDVPGSIAVLLSAPVFIAAFFLEPPEASPMRPVTTAAAFLALVGVVLLVLARKDVWRR